MHLHFKSLRLQLHPLSDGIMAQHQVHVNIADTGRERRSRFQVRLTNETKNFWQLNDKDMMGS